MNRIELRARSIYPSISRSEQKAADYFIQNQEHIFQHPIAVLAQLSDTSQGAWVRFCKSMGYSGMKELKKAFFDELSRSTEADGKTSLPFQDIKDFDSVSDVADVVSSSCIEAIRMTQRLFDPTTMETVADVLIHANSVRLFGEGASGIVAADLYQKLLRIGYSAYYASDFHVALTYLITAGEGDVAVIISNSGETPEVLMAADFLQRSGTPIIGITGHQPSSLIAKCTHVLYMDSPESIQRSSAISSRTAQLLLTDILFTTVASRDYDNIAENLRRTGSVFKASLEQRKKAYAVS